MALEQNSFISVFGRINRVSSIALVCGIAVFVGSCSSDAPKRSSRAGDSIAGPIMTPGVSPTQSKSHENSQYKEVYALYSGGAYEAAIQKMSTFEKEHPNGKTLLPQVLNLHGLSYLATRKPVPAIDFFKRAIATNRANLTFNQYVLYNLAKAQFDANLLDDSQASIGDIHPDVLDKDNRVKVHYLKSRLYTRRGLPVESARECLTASRLFGELHNQPGDVRSSFSILLDQSLKEITNTSDLEELYQTFEDSSLGDQVLFRLGSLELSKGNSEQGEVHLRSLTSRYPQSIYYAQAADLLRLNTTLSTADPMSVGVLLPIKGKFSRFGVKTLQGIELAFRIFNSEETDSKVTLYIEDSGDEPEQAIRGLNNLVIKNHVVAVIGPLLSKGIDQISQRAQELGVPMISLSRYEGISGDYIFEAGLTLKLQAQEMARYAIETLKMKRFAMVYPRDKIGEETSQHFWNAVESMGGLIVGAESYGPNETDFRQPIDKLSGLFYTEARQRELDDLAKIREAQNIKRRTRRTEQFFALKPLVDYDAVFIPDEPKITGQILPTFAYRDVEHVKFLGTSAWNSPEFLTRAQSNGENSIFLDAFFPDTESPLGKHFIDLYRRTFGQDPSSMEALAYDAGRIVDAALTSGAPTASRAEVRDRLKATHGFSGVTGRINYNDGTFSRNLKILTIKSGKTIELN